ncbi:hypothetical protein D8N35_17630 (plasmid) [Enterococcus casseliflavus]|nr:hypothetical protein D8N35_17630 [Enterococcus casseliflavus]
MFGAIEKFFFDKNKQTFFSVISENLKHFNNTVSYHQIDVNGKLLLKEKYDEISLDFHFD